MPSLAELGNTLLKDGTFAWWLDHLHLDYTNAGVTQDVTDYTRSGYSFVFTYHPVSDNGGVAPSYSLVVTDGTNTDDAATGTLDKALQANILTKTTITLGFSGVTEDFAATYVECLDTATHSTCTPGDVKADQICVNDGTTETCAIPSVTVNSTTETQYQADFTLTAGVTYTVYLKNSTSGLQLTTGVSTGSISATDTYTVILTVTFA